MVGSLINTASAEVELKRVSSCQLHNSTVDNNLKSEEAVYEFQLQYPNFPMSGAYYLQYSIDGKSTSATISKKNPLKILTTPGNHVFQFYLNEYYFEIYTDSLLIAPKHHDVYYLYFSEAEYYPVMTEKPVIYVYPDKKTDISLSLDIKGDRPFYYPAYNNGWKFSADPSGLLTIKGNNYNYLFWDAQQPAALKELPKSGFYVASENVVPFLEEKLTKIGLTSKEQADFITYWGPRLVQNKLNMIHFVFNETCNQFAEISVSPSPDHIYRVYMIWSKADQPGKITPQELPTFDRNGYHIIEWGGQEVTLNGRP